MRRWTRALKIGLGTAVLGVLLAPVGLDLDRRFGLSWLFHARGAVAPPEEVVVVSLDGRSAERLGLPERIEDWPRIVHAHLIERLVEAGASIIAFDVIFEDSRDSAQDRIFAEAIAAAGQVVLVEQLKLERGLVDGGGSMALFEKQQRVEPLPILAEAAAGYGPFPLPREPRRVDQFWTFVPGAEGRPSLPLVVLQRHVMAVGPQWRDLLQAGGIEWIGGLPEAPQAWQSGAELSPLMARLRREFLENPQLADRLRDRLAGTGWGPRVRRLLHALIDAYEGPDRRYLNFYGGAGQVPTVPLYQVLAGAAPGTGEAPNLDGRVVFVGLSEPLNVETPDKFMTVFGGSDGIDLNGVEIAATAFANLLERRTLKPAGVLPTLLLVGTFGLAIGMSAASWVAPVAISVALALAALYYAGAQLAFSAHALWLPVAVPILVQVPLGLFAGLLVQYREARRARANISRAMRYYLPEKVATGLAEAPLDPGKLTERVYAACLVSDAERFTSVAEDMSPEEVTGFLNEYFEILFGVVERHGGIVTDVVGDGMTSVWTAVQVERACRLNACLAALEIHRAVGEFNRRFGERGLPTRIGLHAGPALIGNVGGSGRFAYSVMGDSVNTAARIESLNKHLGTQVLATGLMAGDLPELVVRPLGRFQLVGKRETLPIVEIVGRREDACDERLLAEFAATLGALERQEWTHAGELLERILLRYPSDGPSRFYLEECRRYAQGATPPEQPGLVRLERK